MIDIVYIVRNNIQMCEELRYSLRTVDNIEHGKVWLAGGCPENIKPDGWLDIKQRGATKWERTTYTLRKVCESEDVSDAFYLFNDDFFILQEMEEVPVVYNSTLMKRLLALGQSQYRVQLMRTMHELNRRGLGTNNYAVHIPMLIEKEKALEVLDKFEGWPMFRCLYGNYWDIGGVNMPDVKISSNSKIPEDDAQFLSTSDTSFKWGEVGKFIRSRFQEPSRFEVL